MDSLDKTIPLENVTTFADVLHSEVARAAIAATIITQTLSHPFEFVKTGQQLAFGSQPYRMFDNRATLFFAGLAPLNVAAVGTNFVKFYTYPLTVNYLNKKYSDDLTGTSKNKVVVLAGLVTGFFEGVLMVPFENMKNRLIYNAQVSTAREQEVLQLKKIISDLEEKPSTKMQSKQEQQTSKSKRKPLNQAMKYAQEVEELSKTAPRTLSYTEIAKQDKELASQLKNWKVKADYYYANPSTKFHKIFSEIWQVSSFRGFAQASYLTIFQHMATVAIQFNALNYFISVKNNHNYTENGVLNLFFRMAEQHESVDFMMPLAFGVCTSALTVLATQPLDVVKTRMQSSKFSPFQTWIKDVADRTTFVNTFSCLRQTFAENNNAGIKNFYKGWVPRLFRLSILNSGIGFGFYFHLQRGVENYLSGEQEVPLES